PLLLIPFAFFNIVVFLLNMPLSDEEKSAVFELPLVSEPTMPLVFDQSMPVTIGDLLSRSVYSCCTSRSSKRCGLAARASSTMCWRSSCSSPWPANSCSCRGRRRRPCCCWPCSGSSISSLASRFGWRSRRSCSNARIRRRRRYGNFCRQKTNPADAAACVAQELVGAWCRRGSYVGHSCNDRRSAGHLDAADSHGLGR